MNNPMTLCWGPVSPFVRKVMILAYEKGVADRLSLIRTPVAMNSANQWVMKSNPLSKIPTLILGGGVALFDSDVICEYLDSLDHETKFIPEHGEERWAVLRWNAFGSGLLDALILWRNELMRPKEHQSTQTLVAYSQKLSNSLAMLESEILTIKNTPFSLGHIAIGCMFGYLDYRFQDIDWRPNYGACAEWFNSFSERRSAQLTHPALSEDLQTHPAFGLLKGEALPESP